MKTLLLIAIALTLVGCYPQPKYVRVSAGECVVLLGANDSLITAGADCPMHRLHNN